MKAASTSRVLAPGSPPYASQPRSHCDAIAVFGPSATVVRPRRRAVSSPTSVLPAPGGRTTQARRSPLDSAFSMAVSAARWWTRSGYGVPPAPPPPCANPPIPDHHPRLIHRSVRRSSRRAGAAVTLLEPCLVCPRPGSTVLGGRVGVHTYVAQVRRHDRGAARAGRGLGVRQRLRRAGTTAVAVLLGDASATPSETPSASGSPAAAPSMPAGAKGTSAASAEAFARHYVDLINYAMDTGKTGQFVELSSRILQDCRAIARDIEAALPEAPVTSRRRRSVHDADTTRRCRPKETTVYVRLRMSNQASNGLCEPRSKPSSQTAGRGRLESQLRAGRVDGDVQV